MDNCWSTFVAAVSGVMLRIPRGRDQCTAAALINCQARFLQILIKQVEQYLLVGSWVGQYGFTEKAHYDALVSVVQVVRANAWHVVRHNECGTKGTRYDGDKLGGKKLTDFLLPLAKMQPQLSEESMRLNDELRK